MAIYDYDKMDNFVATALLSFQNEELKINLMAFNNKKVEHKCAFEICMILHNLWGYKINVQMSWFKFLIFKLKNKGIEIERIESKEYMTEGPQYNIDKHFEKLLEALQYDSSVIKQVYNEYYKKG